MSRQVVFAEDALADLEEIVDYFAIHGGEAIQRFAKSLAATITILHQTPEIGGNAMMRNSRLQDVRLWQVRDFPRYIIFYRSAEERVEILRVLHSSRDWPAILDA